MRMLLVLISTLSISHFAWTQPDQFSRLLERYEAYRSILPTEKFYLHLNQTTYYPGEDLLFAAHLLNGRTNQYDSTTSTTAYLEIIDNQDSIMIRKAILMENGQGYGQLSLDSLKINSSYRLRAYTNWMQNLGTSTFFEQHIAVVDRTNTATLSSADNQQMSASNGIELDLSSADWVGVKVDRNHINEDQHLLTVQAQQEVVYSGLLELPGSQQVVNIPKAALPHGYFQVVILDEELKVVGEAVAFHERAEVVYDIEITPDQSTKHGDYYMLVTLADDYGDPIKGDFSVSIRKQEEGELRRTNMSDFFGESFNNKAELGQTVQMNWLELNRALTFDTTASYYYMERSVALAGQVTKPNGKPASSTEINLFVNGKVPFYRQTQTNKLGQFILDNLYFEENVDLVLSDAKNRLLDYTIYPIWPQAAKVTPSASNIDIKPKTLASEQVSSIGIEEAFKFNPDDIILAEVEIKGIKEREDLKKGVVRLYGKSEITIDNDDVNFNSGIYANVFQILAGRVSSYIPPPRGGPAGQFQRVSSTSSTVPLCLLNGTPTDCAGLAAIPVALISSIDVTPKAQAIFGGSGANGMIAVYTISAEPRKGTPREINPTAYTLSVEGYHSQELPEIPDYRTKRPEHVKPDYRRTLYWNPKMTTDDFGSFYLSFFMNDLPQDDYVLELEGTDDKGNFVSLQVPLFQENEN